MELRPPSPALSARIREKIAAQKIVDGLAGWPNNMITRHQLLLIHSDGVWVYGLAANGDLFWVDVDDFSQRVEPMGTDAHALNAVAQGARTFPELREMLPERPAIAVLCTLCNGSGDEGQFGKCACEGLGWRVPATSS